VVCHFNGLPALTSVTFCYLQHIEYASVHCDDSDDDDNDDFPSFSRLIEGHEDELGQTQYPDESEEEEEDDDDSWEHFDECDFEDEEDLGDVDSSEAFFSLNIENDVSDSTPCTLSLSCPICQLPPKTTCVTPCGHIFCGL
jgi:E3 ubiquitin-protein ligase RFWD3